MVEIEAVTKTYDTTVAVSDLSLHVERGHTLGLIGPNGSGKTTLLRMVATLAKPDRGRICVAGVDTRADPRAVRRLVSFMPAEFGFPADLTIREYMDYFACLIGIPRDQRARTVDEVLELTDLKGRGEVLIRGLSTGNRQRLLLAKTLLGDAQLLLLDEPASGLDPRARGEVRAIIRELAAMGRTIVISSHILADLEDICAEVCILEAGRQVLAGTLASLRTATHQAARVVCLRVPPAAVAAAQALLAADARVEECHLDHGELWVNSREENCNYLLEKLVAAGIEVCEFRERQRSLEDIFIASTQGKVT